MGYLKELITRVRIDWQEWRGYKTSVWNVKRDKKQIERSIRRAKIKNLSDGKTYYVLKNLAGSFDEVNSNELRRLKIKKVAYFQQFRDYNHLITQSFAIITSNDVVRNSYVETIRNIQDEELKSLNNEQERQKNH